MSRTALTTQEHINSIEYFAMNNPAFESSHYDVIQLIEQKYSFYRTKVLTILFG